MSNQVSDNVIFRKKKVSSISQCEDEKTIVEYQINL